MPRHALIFDLDDTLYPEYEYVCSGMRAVSALLATVHRLNQATVFAELMAIFDGGVRGTVLDAWLLGRNLEREPLLKEMIRAYREHEPDISLTEDTIGVLETLRRVCSLGILSDGNPHAQRLKIRALGLETLVDAVVLTGEIGPEAAKPSTVGFLKALEQLNGAANCAAYIADNPLKDFAGPRSLGMKTVRLIRPAGIYAEAEPPTPGYQADEIIYDMTELLEVVPQLLPGVADTSSSRSSTADRS